MEFASVWAKRGGRKGETGPFHPLMCHLIDVAEVGSALMSRVVSPAEAAWLAEGLGVDEESAVRWIVILTGLHDLGKACGPFQRQVPGNSRDVPHGTVSTAILRVMLSAPEFGLGPVVAKRFATIIGGHHGAIPGAADVSRVDRKLGDASWRAKWPTLVAQITALYPIPVAKPIELDNARAMWLAGFISAADWVGSNASFFSYAAATGDLAEDFDLTTYRNAVAAPAAAKALHDLGWLAVPTSVEPKSFNELFPFIKQPNDLQERVTQVAEQLDEPGLVIVEAPMGEGKSEAALYLADQASVLWGMRGFYVALPTMATSNQMFHRVGDFLGRRYDQEFVQLQLLHGHSSLSEDVDALRRNFASYLTFANDIRGVEGDGDEAALASAVASSWFTGRKQGMLSPFGVGTIDQGLLSILPIKHFFVRLFGLSNKTVILDEVHAYDAYMTTLLERLIGWLAAMNCHVVLLSATLPSDKRARLLNAYRSRGAAVQAAGDDAPIADLTQAYPRISWVSGANSRSTAVDASDRGRKRLWVRWLELEPADPDKALAAELARVLEDGGCAAVICNTVRRAQKIFEALQDTGAFKDEELDLFHARFLFTDRRAREDRCLARYGKPRDDGTDTPCRPTRSVLVATQVVEQSLDLDFDLIVTELAPIDLLLQRSGRLHRHVRLKRPARFDTPQLWVLAPVQTEGMPKFDRGSEYVYFPHILLRTWWELKARTSDDGSLVLNIPDDVPIVIESVYGGTELPANLPPPLHQRWLDSAREMATDEQEDEGVARQWRIKWPGMSGALEEIMPAVLEDEDADAHPAVRAQTRRADPSVTVVCHNGPFRHATFGADPRQWNLAEPNRELLRLCLENSVSISRGDVVSDLLRDSPPTPWKKNSLLRSMRPIQLDVEGGATPRRWRLNVSPTLGVEIQSTKGA